MVTLPGLVGCLYWRWLPLVATKYQPSASIILIISRTFMVDQSFGVTTYRLSRELAHPCQRVQVHALLNFGHDPRL